MPSVSPMEACHGLFLLPVEARGNDIGIEEGNRLMDRLATRTRTIGLEEAREAFPGLREPTRLPDGFELFSAELEEKRDKDSHLGPYYPCRVTLKYTPKDSLNPWLEVEQPGCTRRGGIRPPAGGTELREFLEENMREVSIKGTPGHIEDWEGRDSLALFVFDFDGCLKVSRDPMFSDAVIVDIAELLESVRKTS